MKQKGICPICKKESETLHAFEVDSDQEYCYCPTCGKKLKTKDTIDNFQNTVRWMVRKANYQVHIAGKFEKAYRNFGDILTLQPENPFALTGRALSLMLMSTIRHEKFADALQLVNFAKTELRKQRNQITYFEFLSRTETILKLYTESLYEKLTYKDRFYDSNCILLFFTRIVLISKLCRLVILELENLISKGLTNSRVSLRLQESESFYTALTNLSNLSLLTLKGKAYKCAPGKMEKVAIVEDNEKDSTEVEPKVMRSLLEKEKHCKLIPDRIFKARRGKFILCTCLMAGASLFLTLGIILITLACLIECNTIAMFSIGGASLFIAAVGFITRLILKRKIRKSKLLNIAVEF